MYHRSDNADAYRTNTSFVFSDENTAAVLALLDPQPGDVILDVGCGSGELTTKIHQIVTAQGAPGQVVGIDSSENMIRAANAARTDDEHAPRGGRYVVCDGHDIEQWLDKERLRGSFDKVFSNAALHWMKRAPGQVVKGMRAALKPDKASRLAIEMGGYLNVLGVRSALHAALQRRQIDASSVDPWYFPTSAAYAKLLRQNGFQVASSHLVPRLTPLPASKGIRAWLKTFAGPFLNAVPGEVEREDVVDEVVRELKVDLYDEEEDAWSIMYVRLRVQAALDL